MAGLIPNEVVGAVIEGGNIPVRAWREYLGFTREEVASRVGITVWRGGLESFLLR